MAKIDLDSTNMKSMFSINMRDTISAINNVLSIYDSMEIPSNFSKRQELRDIMERFKTISNNLDDIYNDVIGSNSDYNNLISNLKDQANKLPTYTIKGRNNVV